MNNVAAFRKQLIVGGLALLAVVGFWLLFVIATPVRVQLPEGADSYRLSELNTAKAGITGKSAGIRVVSRDKYLVRYYSGDQVVGIQIWKPAILPFGSLKPVSNTTASNNAAPFMGQSADYVTPLTTNSYIYLNRRTRGIEVASVSGIQDISSRFRLSTKPGSAKNTVVRILPADNNMLFVVTTKDVFLVKSLSDISRLNSNTFDFDPDYISAAYDQLSKSLFMLSSYDKTIYRYNLTKPSDAIHSFHSLKKYTQSISAGGGKVIAYSGNFPTTDSQAIKQYTERYETVPLILDSTSGEQLDSLGDFTAATMVQPSDSGQYIAVKQKFQTTLSIYNLADKTAVIVPAYDVSGMSWLGDTLYIARDNAIWSYAATEATGNLQKVAELGTSASRIVATTNSLTVSTTANLAMSVDLSSAGQVNKAVQDLRGIKLLGGSYATSFTAIGGALKANTQSVLARGGEGIGDEATATNTKIQAAFPGLSSDFTINKVPFPGYYANLLTGGL